jgi:hypothetical protein
MGNGHATLTRGNETIELAANTQIQIYDQGGRKPFTTVVQHFGTVAIEAEVRNVQHFAVKNEYLAAVVKGTRFTVSASRSGGVVEVQRGQVEVDASADHSTTVLSVGQKARVEKAGKMSVAGKGKLPAVVRKGGKTNSQGKGVAANTVPDARADLERAMASGDSEAIKAAEKALMEAAKDAEKAARDADKIGKKAAKDAEKAAKDQAKSDDRARKAADDEPGHGKAGNGGGHDSSGTGKGKGKHGSG